MINNAAECQRFRAAIDAIDLAELFFIEDPAKLPGEIKRRRDALPHISKPKLPDDPSALARFEIDRTPILVE